MFAGLTLRRAVVLGAPRVPVVLLIVPAYAMGGFADHAFPYGSLTFGSLLLCALWIELAPRRSTVGGGHGAEGLPTLLAERLLLRPLTLGDAEAVFACTSGSEVMRYMNFERHRTMEYTRRS